jgi:hypothetical protein
MLFVCILLVSVWNRDVPWCLCPTWSKLCAYTYTAFKKKLLCLYKKVRFPVECILLYLNNIRPSRKPSYVCIKQWCYRMSVSYLISVIYSYQEKSALSGIKQWGSLMSASFLVSIIYSYQGKSALSGKKTVRFPDVCILLDLNNIQLTRKICFIWYKTVRFPDVCILLDLNDIQLSRKICCISCIM